jgi:hypothetical protein
MEFRKPNSSGGEREGDGFLAAKGEREKSKRERKEEGQLKH